MSTGNGHQAPIQHPSNRNEIGSFPICSDPRNGGGHNIAGNALCDDGLVIDLSPMDVVRVDPDAQSARVQGGATWSDLFTKPRRSASRRQEV